MTLKRFTRRDILKVVGAGVVGVGALNRAEATEDETVEIEVDDDIFDPDEVEIDTGTTVRWIWTGVRAHNINPINLPADADWDGHPEMAVTGEYEYTFTIPGVYEYTCDPHPGMDGTVTVRGSDGATPPDDHASTPDDNADSLPGPGILGAVGSLVGAGAVLRWWAGNRNEDND